MSSARSAGIEVLGIPLARMTPVHLKGDELCQRMSEATDRALAAAVGGVASSEELPMEVRRLLEEVELRLWRSNAGDAQCEARSRWMLEAQISFFMANEDPIGEAEVRKAYVAQFGDEPHDWDCGCPDCVPPGNATNRRKIG